MDEITSRNPSNISMPRNSASMSYLPTALAALSLIISAVALVMVWQIKNQSSQGLAANPILGASATTTVPPNILPTPAPVSADGVAQPAVEVRSLFGTVESVNGTTITIKTALTNPANPAETQEKSLTLTTDDKTSFQKEEVILLPNGTTGEPVNSVATIKDLIKGDKVFVSSEADLLTTSRPLLAYVRVSKTIPPPTLPTADKK